MTLVPDANHEGVTFTSLELCDAADIERFVRALALNEDGVSNLVFNGLVESIVLIASVSQVLSSIVPPGLSDAVLLRPHNGLPDVLLLNSLRQRAETLKEHLFTFHPFDFSKRYLFHHTSKGSEEVSDVPSPSFFLGEVLSHEARISLT